MRTSLRQKVVGFGVTLTTILAAAAGTAAAAPGSDNCTWTGGGSNTKWSTAANWSNCSGGAPVNGNSVTFDNSAWSSSLTTDQDIANLALNTLTLNGSSSNQLELMTSNSSQLSLSGGINNTTNANISSDVNIITTGDQTLTGVSLNESLDIKTHTVTIVVGNNSWASAQKVTGSGMLVISNQVNVSGSVNSTFNGTMLVKAGGVLTLNPPQYTIGTGKIIVEDKGNLYILATDSAADITVPNNITITGSGNNGTGALQVCAGVNSPMGGCAITSAGTLRLTGTVTLTGDTVIGASGKVYDTNTITTPQAFTTTIILAGSFVSNNFALTPTANSNTVIKLADGTVINGKVPDTGIALGMGSPAQTLAIVALIAGAVFFVGRRLAPVSVRR